MVQQLNARYTSDLVQQFLPCTSYTNCGNCTSYVSCVWTTTSDTNGISITVGGEPQLVFTNVGFCWTGGFFGGWYKQVQIAGEVVNANFGWNDYLWQQCQMRGGVAILLIVFGVIACIIGVYCCVVCCLVFFGHQCRKKKNLYYKQKDDH